MDLRVDPIRALLIGVFWWSTPPGSRLSAVETVTDYNKILAWAFKAQGLKHLRLTAHCPRAGWATRLRMAGVPFPVIMERGR